MPSTNPRHKFWILTIPYADWQPPTNISNCNASYIAGQREISDTGYDHWQVVAYYTNKVRLGTVKADFTNTTHAEPTRSDAARDYVWKDETSVEGSRFELGTLPFRRNNRTDWAAVRRDAVSGNLNNIPDNVYVQNYISLRKIAADNLVAPATISTAVVYYGPTGVGKSRRAWHEAGMDSYPKDPRTKWWCGYRDQRHVVVDEYRGDIAISHLLRWLDRYPCLLEQKGSTTVKQFTKVWFTSNIHPNEWYPDLDTTTKAALLRRLTIEEMTEDWTPPTQQDEDLIDVDNLINLLNE